ncbi:conserved hypothetical protein [Aeromonas phage 65]|uniref:Uncharacterized protein n=2 Tax=Ishigurovirus osborne TaxID=260149 RepID=A0A219YC15_9CAUD|nr:hypothetical protein ST65p165 [Aeromonas phage 65]ADQ53173.1 conserved hypothetical protein [Aeromonas phage 65]APU01551.1 hypothetical protein [Aeromonas phage 65.2]
MVSPARITKVKLRIKEEKEKLSKNSLVSWGVFFVAVSLGSLFASSMYGPILLGALSVVLFQWVQLHNLASDRVGILGKAYENPLVLVYLETGIDGVKDLDESITKWEDMTTDDREAQNKKLNVMIVVSAILVIAVITATFSGIFWLLPA